MLKRKKTSNNTSDQRDRYLLQAVERSQALIFFEPNGTIVDANDAFLGAIGYSLDEVVGKHHRMFMMPGEADSAEYQQFWERLGNGEIFSQDFARRHKSGKAIWINASYNPVFDDDGNVAQVIKLAVDITPQKEAVNAIVETLSELSTGDLTTRIATEVSPDFSAVRSSLNDTLDNLERSMNMISNGSTSIENISQGVENSSRNLSSQAQEQAVFLEETTQAIKSISAGLSETNEAAKALENDAQQAAQKSKRGHDILNDTIDAIRSIETLMRDVSKTTEVIESFAFQTNLLSLNAAVEAARAGDAGKGFAVVASEVRILANRSAEASKDIGALIKRCEDQVATGTKLALSAGTALEEISDAAASVAEAVDSIAVSSSNQAVSVRSVEESADLLNKNIAQLAALSEDGEGQAKGLGEEIRTFKDVVSQFRISGEDSKAQQATSGGASFMRAG